MVARPNPLICSLSTSSNENSKKADDVSVNQIEEITASAIKVKEVTDDTIKFKDIGNDELINNPKSR